VITVPAKYIRFAPVDYAGEIGCLLGVWPEIGDGVRIPPPAVGHWALLELIDSRTVKSPTTADPLDVLRTAFVLAQGPSAVELCQRHAREVKRPTTIANPAEWSLLDHEASRWAAKTFKQSKVPDVAKLCKVLTDSFNGFSLLPGGQSAGRVWLFAGEGIASTIRTCRPLNLPYERVLWNVPLLLVGHLVSAQSAAGGDPVARPRDPEDIRRQLRLAKEREAAGMLHPWQIADPEGNDPSKEQLAANPRLKRLHKILVAERRAAK
jgi:hypothetical protein